MRNPFSKEPPKPEQGTVAGDLEAVIEILKREFRDGHPDWRDVFKACVRIELK